MQTENFSPTHLDRLDHVKMMDEASRHSWLKEERAFWEEIFNNIRSTNGMTYERNLVENYLKVIDIMIVDFTDFSSMQHFHDLQPLPLHDEQPHAEQIMEFARKNQFSIARYLFQSLILQQSALYINKYKSDLSNHEENVKNSIKSENEKYLSSLTETRKAFDIFAETTKKEVKEDLSKQIEFATTEISNTVTTATKAILSAEPVKYWEEREKIHREKAKSYKRGVIASSIAFISTLIFLTLSVYKNGETYTILDRKSVV